MISWVRWRLDPKREDIELQLVLNHRDEAPHRKASRILSKLLFFKTRAPLFQRSKQAVTRGYLFWQYGKEQWHLSFLMYQERCWLFASWVTLLVNGERALPAQKRENLQWVNLFFHFSRENFEGLEKTRGYLSHNMRVKIFWYNIIPPKV